MAPAGASPAGVVACWHLDLAQPDPVVRALGGVLSPDERARADRFVFPRDRRRFVVARAGLRALLAQDGDPTAVRFTYSPLGKPALAGGGPCVHFNLSHAADLALVALSRDDALGVDIEAVRALPDLQAIAARYFTAAEAATILGLPPAQRELAFFLCWTRKEAFSKALGDGLTLALDRYRVACHPAEPARVHEIDGSAAAGAAWTVYDLRPAEGFVGAVAMRAGRRPLTLARLDVVRDVLPRCLP